jgi:hypothetical protein
MGSVMAENLKPDERSDSPPPKKINAFFGIGTESIQLDGVNVKGYNEENPKPG